MVGEEDYEISLDVLKEITVNLILATTYKEENQIEYNSLWYGLPSCIKYDGLVAWIYKSGTIYRFHYTEY